MNPARSFAPDVISGRFSTYHWIYWLGPAMGTCLAAGFYKLIKHMKCMYLSSFSSRSPVQLSSTRTKTDPLFRSAFSDVTVNPDQDATGDAEAEAALAEAEERERRMHEEDLEAQGGGGESSGEKSSYCTQSNQLFRRVVLSSYIVPFVRLTSLRSSILSGAVNPVTSRSSETKTNVASSSPSLSFVLPCLPLSLFPPTLQSLNPLSSHHPFFLSFFFLSSPLSQGKQLAPTPPPPQLTTTTPPPTPTSAALLLSNPSNTQVDWNDSNENLTSSSFKPTTTTSDRMLVLWSERWIMFFRR